MTISSRVSLNMRFAAGYLRFAVTRIELDLHFAFTRHNSNYCFLTGSDLETLGYYFDVSRLSAPITNNRHRNRYYLSTATMRLRRASTEQRQQWIKRSLFDDVLTLEARRRRQRQRWTEADTGRRSP